MVWRIPVFRFQLRFCPYDESWVTTKVPTHVKKKSVITGKRHFYGSQYNMYTVIWRINGHDHIDRIYPGEPRHIFGQGDVSNWRTRSRHSFGCDYTELATIQLSDSVGPGFYAVHSFNSIVAMNPVNLYTS